MTFNSPQVASSDHPGIIPIRFFNPLGCPINHEPMTKGAVSGLCFKSIKQLVMQTLMQEKRRIKSTHFFLKTKQASKAVK